MREEKRYLWFGIGGTEALAYGETKKEPIASALSIVRQNTLELQKLNSSKSEPLANF
jgi:hypothetical protein